jgi:hypothetical protein
VVVQEEIEVIQTVLLKMVDLEEEQQELNLVLLLLQETADQEILHPCLHHKVHQDLLTQIQ